VIGPAILVLDNLLHPKEYEPGNEPGQLAEIADSYTRWQLAHLLGFLALVIFAVAILGLAFLVRRRRPALGLAGGALGLAGLLGFAGVIAIDGFTWGVLGHVYGQPGTDPATVEKALDEVQSSAWSLPFYTLPLAWIAGMIMLAVGAARQRAVPGWAAGLLVLAAVLAGTETAVVDNTYFIVGAAMLLAGGTAVAVPIVRMSDEAFAAGGSRAGAPWLDENRE
jgi:hypothetical protein